MNLLRPVAVAVLLASLAAAAGAATFEMPNYAPADAKAVIEAANVAGLRQTLMESKFWDALQDTAAFQEWRASGRYAEMQERIDQFLANLGMSKDEALKTYLGGRAAVILLAPAEGKKPDGVLLLETPGTMAEKFIQAAGGQEVGAHRKIVIWEVAKGSRTDRLAYAGGVLAMTNARGDALERVLDVIASGGGSLGSEAAFKAAAGGLPAGWSVRAYAAKVPPRKGPGAVAVYPQEAGAVHIEWHLTGEDTLAGVGNPVVLTSPAALPDSTVAAVATALHPAELYTFLKAKAAEKGAADKVRQAEMFLLGLFPGQSIEAVLAGFGPEAGLGLVKSDGDGAPGLLGLVRLTATGGPVAKAFKDGLAAKAMILAALAQGRQDEGKPKFNLDVHEETYGDTRILTIKAPAALAIALGDWADDVALTVAVTDDWLMVGTTLASVKASLDAAVGKRASLVGALAKDGVRVPVAPATRWGVIEPARGSDIVFDVAEKVAGKERVEQARKLTNLAELLKLVKRIVWQRVDDAEAIHGSADVEATN